MFKPSSPIQLISFLVLIGTISSFVLIELNYKDVDFPQNFNTTCNDFTLSKINLDFTTFIKVSLVMYAIICISQLIIYRINLSLCGLLSINIFASLGMFMLFAGTAYFVHLFKDNSDCFKEYREYRIVKINSFIAMAVSYIVDIFVIVLIGISALFCSYRNGYESINY